MFSLIITIFAIALVVLLALATVYYGGSALRQGKEAAQAATVVNQAQQILGAYDLFKAKTGRYPDSLDELVPEYLQTVPQAFAAAEPDPAFSLVQTAYAADAGLGVWRQPTPGVPVVLIDSGISETLCQQVNLKVRGDSGILDKPYGDLSIQCFGTSTSTLQIVLNNDATTLPTALPQGQVTGGHDAVTSGTGWTVPPGTSSQGNGNGGSPSNPPDPTPPPATPFNLSVVDGYVNNGWLTILLDIPLDANAPVFQVSASGDGTTASGNFSYGEASCTVKKGSTSQRCSLFLDLGGASPSSMSYTVTAHDGASSGSGSGVASAR